MVQYRLQLVSPLLLNALKCADDRLRAEVAAEVCERGLRAAALGDASLLEAVQALRQGGRISADLRKRVSMAADDLDEIYLNASDEARAAGMPQGVYAEAFRKARAAAAVQLALLDDRLEAVAEAIYEVQSTFEDPSALLAEIGALVARTPSA